MMGIHQLNGDLVSIDNGKGHGLSTIQVMGWIEPNGDIHLRGPRAPDP